MKHIPVLLRECVEVLDLAPGKTVLDATLGRAGHASAMMRKVPGLRLVGIDRDTEAINYCKAALSEFGESVIIEKANFSEVRDVLDKNNIESVDAMICDLGISSPMIDDPSRGFSFSKDSPKDTPIDMRMDQEQELTAATIVNTWHRDEIARILREYGEERYSCRIANAIVRERNKEPINTTGKLTQIIEDAMPPAGKREKQPAAARSYMALRIAVNRELQELEELLKALPGFLAPGGIAAIISFHSLEDRLVKNAFHDYEDGCKCSKAFPCVCGFKQEMRVITRKPITPSNEETAQNPRSRSAKLRAAQKI